MTERSTRDALLAEGAILFARHGVDGVTARQLHEAVGTRNESALHYHFGDRDGLVSHIVLGHLAEIEARRRPLVEAIEADDRTGDVRALVHALAAPMAADLDSEIGRAHLRVVAQISPPQLAYERPFQVADLPSGRAIVDWLQDALSVLPARVRVERLAALRAQLISLFALRAQLLDDLPATRRRSSHAVANDLFLSNLLDLVVAGLEVKPSPDTLAAAESLAEPKQPTAS